jgi:hypothetical protein
MAAIWTDITLEWDGEEYTVRPTMELINLLEQGEGRSLSRMFIRLNQQDLPSSVACDLIAKVLRYGGADVTAEDVFAKTGGGLNRTAIVMVMQILAALMPPVDIPGTAQAAKKKTPAKR